MDILSALQPAYNLGDAVKVVSAVDFFECLLIGCLDADLKLEQSAPDCGQIGF